ncbi:MAG: rhamnogalacturonan acetylesterase [Clostridiales bacterium]|nr:rhamnogalacturonan acetylesterase [Clostridiales bacterium]
MQTIFVIGDSTVENGSDPYYGWGGQLQDFLPGARVDNHAFSGRSSKSFWNENRFEPILPVMKQGDVLLIGFGHNDEKDDSERHTDPETTFPEMLMRYVGAARTAGAVPVICTSISRNYIGENGFVMYTHGAYPQSARQLCVRENIPLIDLEVMTRELLRSLGQQKACDLFVNIPPGTDERFPDGIADRTHLNLFGARKIAEMAANRLKECGLLQS